MSDESSESSKRMSMPEYLTISDVDFAGIDDVQFPKLRLVTDLGAELDESCKTIVLSVEYKKGDQASYQAGDFDFAISPPAAARLSRLLAAAVEKYLYGDDHQN